MKVEVAETATKPSPLQKLSLGGCTVCPRRTVIGGYIVSPVYYILVLSGLFSILWRGTECHRLEVWGARCAMGAPQSHWDRI